VFVSHAGLDGARLIAAAAMLKAIIPYTPAPAPPIA
jgi:hypothetical protein